jgi:hypothetical protein
MAKIDLPKPRGTLKIDKIFVNKRNGQMMIILPKKKMRNTSPISKVEVAYW